MSRSPVCFRFSAFADEIDPSFDVQLSSLKELGISLLELRGVDGKSFVSLNDEDVREVGRKLRESGIGLSALGSPIGKIRTDDDFDAHLKLLDRVMDIGEMLDCQRIRMFSFYPPKGRPERDASFESAVFERMEKMLEKSEKRGFVLCHENEKDIYGESIASEKRLLEEFGGRLKAVLDPGNFAFCRMDARPAYAKLKEYVEYMHLKDADENGDIVVPGEGKACLKEILKDVADDPERKGSTVILTVEPHLMDFAGLSALAAEGAEIRHKRTFRTQKEAFETAFKALVPMAEAAGRILP